jgi:hypothetical protein
LDVAIGILLWILVIGWLCRPRTAAPGNPSGRPPRDGDSRSDHDRGGGGYAAGWVIGHHLAHDRTDFPGDPLPDGHLGSATDLAFWGGLFADDEDASLD